MRATITAAALLLLQLTLLVGAGRLPDLDKRASPLNVGGFIAPTVYQASGLTTRSTAAQFQASTAFNNYTGVIRSLKLYTTVYGPQQKSVAPSSSTILAMYHFPTNAATLCSSRCDSNVDCGGIEMFVERVPVTQPSATNSTPAANFWIICRQHSKKLSASDATFVQRGMVNFTRTQVAVYFANKKVWTQPKAPTTSCSSGKNLCPPSYACTASGKCVLAVGSTCAGSASDSTCVTGLCTSIDATATAKCVRQGLRNVQSGQHCITSADCEKNGVCNSGKRCGPAASTTPPPPTPVTCSPACSATQYCLVAINGKNATCVGRAGSNVGCKSGDTCLSGVCNDGSCLPGALATPCSATSDCSSGFCVKGMCASSSCGVCQEGQVCITSGATPQCMSIAGGPCTADAQCFSNKCGSDGCAVGGPAATCSADKDCVSGKCIKEGNAATGSCTTAACASCTGPGQVCDTTSASSPGSGLAACRLAPGATCLATGSLACLSGACPSDDKAAKCPLGAPGTACTRTAHCQGNACSISSGQTIGSCGESCSGGCTAPQVCLTGKCVSPGAVSSPCSSAEFCTSGSCVDGKCAATVDGICSSDGDCTTDRFCNKAATSSRCAAKASAGADCSGDSGCITGRCDGSKCQLSQEGGRCGSASDCTTQNCLTSGLCGTAPFIPPPPPALLGPGKPCERSTQCSNGLGSTGQCTSDKVCAKYAKQAQCSNNNECLGNDCQTTCQGDCAGTTCAAGQYCQGSNCADLRPANQACTSDAACTTGRCSSATATPGTCQASAPGGACKVGSSADCASGFCIPPDGFEPGTTTYTAGKCGKTCVGTLTAGEYCNDGQVTAKLATSATSSCSADVQCLSGVCEGGVCSGCSSDDHCSGTAYFCSLDDGAGGGGTCTLKKSAGQYCGDEFSSSSTGVQCASGFCDDSVQLCQGGGAANAACANNNDCLGSFCEPGATGSLGKCKDDCGEVSCAAGKYCQGTSCVDLLSGGEACTSDAACVTGRCSSATADTGVCQASGTAGKCRIGSTAEDCGSNSFCVPAEGATLAPDQFATGTCRKACVTVPTDSQFCRADGTTIDKLENRDACIDKIQCAQGRCVQGKCTNGCTNDEDCTSTQFCLNPGADKAGACVQKGVAGDACGEQFKSSDLGVQCGSGVCNADGTCKLGGANDDCTFNDDCTSHFCSSGTCIDDCSGPCSSEYQYCQYNPAVNFAYCITRTRADRACSSNAQCLSGKCVCKGNGCVQEEYFCDKAAPGERCGANEPDEESDCADGQSCVATFGSLGICPS